MRLIGWLALALAVIGCQAATPEGPVRYRYVALGDSYTIGTSVAEAERWPNQLVAALADSEPGLELVGNLAVNGYTTADLIADELPQLAALDPEFVTLQIGVNDVVQGVPAATTEANLRQIVGALVSAVGADRVLCVATPDYTVTPVGIAGLFGDPAEQRAGIEAVNGQQQAICDESGVRYVSEIFAISQAAATDGSLVAGDGLHPSGAQYARWVEAILPAVRELLAR